MTAKPETTKKHAWIWRYALGITVMGIVVWALVKELDWQDVVVVLQNADYGWVGVGVLMLVVNLFARAWRWQVLLRVPELKLRPIMTAMVVGQMVNVGLPIVRSGDVARALWIGRSKAVSSSEALGTVAMEKVWNMVAALLCGLILLLLLPLPAWFSQSTWGTAVVLLIGIVLLFLGLRFKDPLFRFALRLLHFLPERWTTFVMPRVERIIRGLDSLREPSTSAHAFFWTMVIWTLGTLTNWCVMRGFGIQSLPIALLIMVTLMIGGALVPVPGQLGLTEGVSVVCLGLIGVSEDRGFAVGLVLHLVTLLVPALAAAILVAWYQAKPEERNA